MDVSIFGFLVIAAMGLTVYATRIAGSELMSLFNMTPRLEAVLKAMASSVLVAIVVSECARGSLRTSAAVAVASIVMLAFRNPLIAMSGGVVTAAAVSFMS
mgnify:CR=1 FL=1